MTTLDQFIAPFSSLERVHSIDDVDSAVKDLSSFLTQFISLIILVDLPTTSTTKPPFKLKNANKICTSDTAHALQRVLWINDKDLLAELKPILEVAIKSGFPDQDVKFENLAALSLAKAPSIEEAKAAYLIYNKPSDYPDFDPNGRKKKLNTPEMKIAFSKALLQTSKPKES